MSYARQVAMVARLIAKKGQSATWFQTNQVVNGAQPWKTTAGVQTSFPVKILRLFLGKTELSKPVLQLIAGTSISTDQEMVFMPGNVPFTPQLNDTITVNGVSNRISELTTIQPDGTPIMHVFAMV